MIRQICRFLCSYMVDFCIPSHICMYVYFRIYTNSLVYMSYKLLHPQILRVGIQSVFNLQQPGEHKNCGPGIEESSGFSYCPEDLMSEGC